MVKSAYAPLKIFLISFLNMRQLILLLLLLLPTALSTSADTNHTDRIHIYEFLRRNCNTNVWWLTSERFRSLPNWNPENNEKIPLSLDSAMKIASKWVAAKESGVCPLQSISIEPIGSPYGQGPRVFYYRFIFHAALLFDYTACIVLMDGTVMEPEKYH